MKLDNNSESLTFSVFKLNFPEPFAWWRHALPPVEKISRHAFLQGREEEASWWSPLAANVTDELSLSWIKFHVSPEKSLTEESDR